MEHEETSEFDRINMIARIKRILHTTLSAGYVSGVEESEKYYTKATSKWKNTFIFAIMVTVAVILTIYAPTVINIAIILISLILMALNMTNEATLLVSLALRTNTVNFVIMIMRAIMRVVVGAKDGWQQQQGAINLLVDALVGGLIFFSSTRDEDMNKQWTELEKEGNWRIGRKLDIDNQRIMSKITNTPSTCRIAIRGEVNSDKRIKTGFDLYRFIRTTKDDLEIIKKFDYAEQDDDMLGKALNKRIIGTSKKINTKAMKEAYKIIVDKYSVLEPVRTKSRTIKEAVHDAFSTDGSVGYFMKKTLIEENFKSVNNERSMQIMEGICYMLLEQVRDMKRFKEAAKPYWLYQKVEAIERDEKGDIKITRLMQATNMLYRPLDSWAFGVMNETIVHNAYRSEAKIGADPILTVLTHLKVNERTDAWVVNSDIENFDGSQHPYLMAACRRARIRQLIANGLFEEALYVAARYEIEIHRFVTIKDKGIIEVVGLQPSGSITTSDDNTMRIVALITMALIRTGLYHTTRSTDNKGVHVLCAGDNITVVTYAKEEALNLMERMREVGTDLGMVFKELTLQPITDKPSILGYTCVEEMIRVKIGDRTVKLSINAVTRTEDRAIAKLYMGAEWDTKKTTKNVQKQLSKCISSMITRPMDIVNIVRNMTIIYQILSSDMIIDRREMSYAIKVSGMKVYDMTVRQAMREHTIITDGDIELFLNDATIRTVMEILESTISNEATVTTALIKRSKGWINMDKLMYAFMEDLSIKMKKTFQKIYNKEVYEKYFTNKGSLKGSKADICEHINYEIITLVKTRVTCRTCSNKYSRDTTTRTIIDEQ